MAHDSKRVRGVVASLAAAGLAGAGLAAAGVAALPPASTSAAVRHQAFQTTDRYHSTIAVSKVGTKLADSQSTNWSGYNEGILDSKTRYSSISATWIVPTASQHVAGQAEDSATWIGIGGGCLNSACDATDATLIQAGTEQDVSSAGKATYDAWWEIIPEPETLSTIVVHPGDTINCSIASKIPGDWTITLTDVTDHQSFTKTTPYPSDESTAEWIEETPTEIGTSGAGLAALPNLTTVHFTNAKVNGAKANFVPAQGVQLTDANGKVIADPSAPIAGTEFNDCAWAKTCAAP